MSDDKCRLLAAPILALTTRAQNELTIYAGGIDLVWRSQLFRCTYLRCPIDVQRAPLSDCVKRKEVCSHSNSDSAIDLSTLSWRRIVNTSRIACLALALLGSAVFASPASATLATASLDWSKLEILVLGIPGQAPLPLVESGNTTSWDTSATSVNDSSDSHKHGANSWTTALDIKSDTPNASGDANASATLFSTSATATDSNSGDPTRSNQSTASLKRTVDVDVTGPATVLFSVPYSLTQDGTDFAHHTTASVKGSASFTPTGAFSTIDDTSRTFTLDSQSGSTLPSQAGSLIFGLVVDRPGSVSATFDASSLASAPDPVPEPSVALFGMAGGLLVTGVFAVRRRLRRR